jgi:hypothetical protein
MTQKLRHHNYSFYLFLTLIFALVELCFTSPSPRTTKQIILPKSSNTVGSSGYKDEKKKNIILLPLLYYDYPPYSSSNASSLLVLLNRRQERQQEHDSNHANKNYSSASATIHQKESEPRSRSIVGKKITSNDDDLYNKEAGGMNLSSKLMAAAALKNNWKKLIKIRFPKSGTVVFDAMKNQTMIQRRNHTRSVISNSTTSYKHLKQLEQIEFLLQQTKNHPNSTVSSSSMLNIMRINDDSSALLLLFVAYACIFACLSIMMKHIIHNKTRKSTKRIKNRAGKRLAEASFHFLEYEVPPMTGVISADIGGGGDDDDSSCYYSSYGRGVEYYGSFSCPWKSDLEKFDL